MLLFQTLHFVYLLSEPGLDWSKFGEFYGRSFFSVMVIPRSLFPASLKKGEGSMHDSGGRTPLFSILPEASHCATMEGGIPVPTAPPPMFHRFVRKANRVNRDYPPLALLHSKRIDPLDIYSVLSMGRLRQRIDRTYQNIVGHNFLSSNLDRFLAC